MWEEREREKTWKDLWSFTDKDSFIRKRVKTNIKGYLCKCHFYKYTPTRTPFFHFVYFPLDSFPPFPFFSFLPKFKNTLTWNWMLFCCSKRKCDSDFFCSLEMDWFTKRWTNPTSFPISMAHLEVSFLSPLTWLSKPRD